MHRRNFLSRAIALPAMLRTAALFPRADDLAAAEMAPPFPGRGADQDVRFGCASLTWGGRDDVAIDEIAALGYRGVQLRTAAFDRWHDRETELVRLLALRRLTLVALSSGNLRLDPSTFEDDMAVHSLHARFVQRCGGKFLQVIDERPRGRAPTRDDFARMGERLTELGKRTARRGVTLVYHNHMGALGQSPEEVDAVLAASDPQYVRFLLDIAHYQQAGGDPVGAVSRHASRIALLHLKDVERVTPSAERRATYRFVELGRGDVDIKGVMAALRAARWSGWGIVELDSVTAPDRTPRECAETSKDYLASIGHPI